MSSAVLRSFFDDEATGCLVRGLAGGLVKVSEPLTLKLGLCDDDRERECSLVAEVE